jgi:dihydrofolate reductase
MKKLVVGTFLTLDGVMQAPGSSEEDKAGGFKYGGWQMPYFDADSGRIMDKIMAENEAMLLGRITYQIFAGYWPTAPADEPIAARMNSMPKYVVSNTLKKLDWNNSKLINGNVGNEIARIKAEPGNGVLSVVGSGKLAQTLMREKLIDEYVLWIYPIILGTGKRLFEGGVVPANLKLTDTKTTGSGVMVLTYQPT